MRDLIWDGADDEHHTHLVCWDAITHHKELGGLVLGVLLYETRHYWTNGGGISNQRWTPCGIG